MFKVKIDEEGNFPSRKSRVTARGFTERPGIDFFEIFHPVGRGQTLNILLASCVQLGWKLFHIDIKGAFLHAVLPEEIYMTLPEWIDDGETRTLVKLKKSLYGLKQAGREWYLSISKFLIEKIGCKQSKCDPCLFRVKNRKVIIFLYVDDILVMAENDKEYENLVSRLKEEKFEIGSDELTRWYLGQRIIQEQGVIRITQVTII